jgi:hypothetical protein
MDMHPPTLPKAGSDIDLYCANASRRAGKAWAEQIDDASAQATSWRDWEFFNPVKNGLEEGPSLTDALHVLRQCDYKVPSDAMAALQNALSAQSHTPKASRWLVQDVLVLGHRLGMLGGSEKQAATQSEEWRDCDVALQWRSFALAKQLGISSHHPADRDDRLVNAAQVIEQSSRTHTL